MCARLRAISAALLALVLVARLPLPADHGGGSVFAIPASAQGVSRQPMIRLAIPEPARRTPLPMLPPSAVHAIVTTKVRAATGVAVPGPPMLKPPFLIPTARAASARSIATTVVTKPAPRTARAAGSVATASPNLSQCICGVCPPPTPTPSPNIAQRSTHPLVIVQCTPSPAPTATPVPTSTPIAAPTSSATSAFAPGTGIKPWWPYQEERVPGAGHVMVNVATGNLLIDEDDMTMPNAGVTLAYHRTYNLKSGHDVTGSDGSAPSMVGNGWSSTWDAHISGDPTSVITVWDGDGARYDYSLASDHATWLPPPGQHNRLVSDGHCGMLWVSKNGITYYFYALQASATCSGSVSQSGGYAGRLYQIFGRNTNTWVKFSYVWDNGNAGPTGKVANITAGTQSGAQATLVMWDFNGHRLASNLSRPDGTVVRYQYDDDGNLTVVSMPSNNSSSTPIPHMFSYGASSNNARYMVWASSPRWASSSATDGAYLYFGVVPIGSTVSLSSIGHVGWINPIVTDSVTSGRLQSSPTGSTQYSLESYGLGTIGTASTETFRDSDGHYTNWATNAAGNLIQAQQCATTQNQQCTGQLLISGEQWDTNDNLIATVEPRGFAPGANQAAYETDAVYDANGNVVAAAAPQAATSQGTLRPTSLYSYDTNNNLTAYCDPVATHSLSADWGTTPPAAIDTLCPQSTVAQTFLWSGSSSNPAPAYEPNGQLQSIVLAATTSAPNGYHESVTYDPSRQAGADLGLPTSIVGEAAQRLDGTVLRTQQPDGTIRQPRSDFWYTASGWLGCYSSGAGTSVLSYDLLGRPTARGDGDDSSMTNICSKSDGQPYWNTVASTAYYPDGSVKSTASPSEAMLNLATSFTYDMDGNMLTQAAHHGCTPNACMSGVTQHWYDGSDRLIETSIPKDASNSNDIPWIIRYIYDLTAGGTSAALSGLSVVAHGNAFETQKSSPGGFIDIAVTGYDALDRRSVHYGFVPCTSGTSPGPMYCNSASYGTKFNWDAGSALGLLTSVTDGLNETKSYAYDLVGRTTAIQYAGDNGVTPAMSYAYDLVGRLVQSTAGVVGAEKYTYDVRGNLISVQEAAAVGSGTMTYGRYGDSSLSAVSVSDPLLQQANLLNYSYRADGLPQQLQIKYGTSSSTLAYAYTNGGRLSQRSDFGSAPSLTTAYDTAGRLKSYTIPAGTYDGIQYDAEGDVLSYTGYNGETVYQTYNSRGDLIAENFTPNVVTSGYTAWPAFTYQNVQGITVQSSTQEWDGRTGALLSSSATYDAVGRLTSVLGGHFTYDAENRVISGSTDRVSIAGNCGSGVPRSVADNSTTKYTFGPSGRIAQAAYSDPLGGHPSFLQSWHWSGGSLLYTDKGSSVDEVIPDSIGIIPAGGAAPGLTLSDPDPNGYQASRHNATGYGNWSAPNPLGQKCVSEAPGAASTGFVDVTAAISLPFGTKVDDGENVTDESGNQVLAAAMMPLTPSRGSQYVLRRAFDDCPIPVQTDSRQRSVMGCGSDPGGANGNGDGSGGDDGAGTLVNGPSRCYDSDTCDPNCPGFYDHCRSYSGPGGPAPGAGSSGGIGGTGARPSPGGGQSGQRPVPSAPSSFRPPYSPCDFVTLSPAGMAIVPCSPAAQVPKLPTTARCAVLGIGVGFGIDLLAPEVPAAWRVNMRKAGVATMGGGAGLSCEGIMSEPPNPDYAG